MQQFDIYIYSVPENHNIEVFATCGHLARQTNTNHYTLIFFMRVKNTFGATKFVASHPYDQIPDG